MDEKRLESLRKKPDQANFITLAELNELIRLARLGLKYEREQKVMQIADKVMTEHDSLFKDLAKQEEEDKRRLIELGLWAEKHAVPALTKSSVCSGWCDNPMGCGCKAPIAKEALAALPSTNVSGVSRSASEPSEETK